METQLLIDNQTRAAKSGSTFEPRHPTSGDLVTRGAAAGIDDAMAAVESASIAFKSWRHSAPTERRRILLKAADALEARMPAFIESMAAEVGASALWAGFMTIYDDETFGPITTVVRVKGVEEAIAVANDTAYGLSAGVFGRDVTRAIGVALQIDTGCCHVNGATVQNEAQAPYGGTKDSGYGRFDGRAVIDEFTELKWITIEPSVQQYPV